MKNVRFYLEGDDYGGKPRRHDDGNVIAVLTDTYLYGRYDALASVYDWHDSAVAGTTVDLWHCTRISERRARELHPALFERLDNSQ